MMGSEPDPILGGFVEGGFELDLVTLGMHLGQVNLRPDPLCACNALGW